MQVGSVDEESTKSDEEYDDLAMQDIPKNGYWYAEDEVSKEKLGHGLHLRTISEPVPESLCSYSSMYMENSERRIHPGKGKFRKRSLSIPASKKNGSTIIDPIFSSAPQR